MASVPKLYAEENFPPHWYVRRMIGEAALIPWVAREGTRTAFSYSLNKIIENAECYLRGVNSDAAVNMKKVQIAVIASGNDMDVLTTTAKDVAALCGISADDHPKENMLAEMSMADKAKLREHVLFMKSYAEKLIKELGLSQPAHSLRR